MVGVSVTAPDLSLRPATSTDLAPLLDLAVRTFVDTFAPFNSAENLSACIAEHYAPERFARDLLDPRARVIVAEARSGALAAYARMRWGNAPDCVDDREAVEIEKLYVDRPHHRRGVGSMLMRHCLDFARASGRWTVYLSVWEHNQRAIAFYEKWGFVRVGEHLFPVGDDPQIDWWMARAVEPEGD